MEHLIRKIAQDHLWNQWVAANSAGGPTLDAGCISRKEGCISRKDKAGCISRKDKAGCISRKEGCISRKDKAGCISRKGPAMKAGCIS